jgi:hypothetical protein
LVSAGVALSDLHRQTRLTKLAPSRELLSEARDKETLAMIAESSPRLADDISKSLSLLLGAGASQSIGPTGLCHGDVRPMNMRVHDFDFDDCGRPSMARCGGHGRLARTHGRWPCWRTVEGLPDMTGYGLDETDSFVYFVGRIVAGHQLRILRFLFDHCELDGALWADVLTQAKTTVSKAAHPQLRAIVS